MVNMFRRSGEKLTFTRIPCATGTGTAHPCMGMTKARRHFYRSSSKTLHRGVWSVESRNIGSFFVSVHAIGTCSKPVPLRGTPVASLYVVVTSY